MVYTVTLNPAVDYYVYTEELRVGEVGRATRESLSFGGKGINVSRVLSALGVQNKALGFLAGFTGHAIEEALQGEGLSTDFCFLPSGLTRINVKLRHGAETDVNGTGAAIPAEALPLLYERLRGLKGGDSLVLAGSAPHGLPETVYGDILSYASDKGVYTAVDASGALLLHALREKPFLVKPNQEELIAVLGRPLSTESEQIRGARELQARGARNVLLSRGKDGALLLLESGECYRMDAPHGECVNSVGAGDAMLAGFLSGFLGTDGDASYALRLGTAAGSATAFSAGFPTCEEIETVLCTLGDPVRIF